MGLKFDPQTGLSADETATIREAIRNDFANAFAEEGAPPLNVAAESPAGQLIDSETALVSAKDSEILFLANQFNPDVAQGRWQEALGKIYFINRKIDESTVVTCVCTGLYGTAIPAGSLARTDDGHVIASISSATIGTDSAATVFFRTRETGAIAIAANSVNTIITVIPGWDTISNPTAGSPGRSTESRAEFEARRKLSVALNAHGSAIAIYSAIAALDGVLDCVVLENYTNVTMTKYGVAIEPHSICASIYGGSDADIAEAIYLKKDGGCGTVGNTQVTHIATEYFNTVYVYNILRPTATPFKIHVNIVSVDGTPGSIEDDIKSALLDDFYGRNEQTKNTRVGMAQRVYASRFYPAVIQTAGVLELVDMQVALGTGAFADYVDVRADVEPILSADDIAIEFVSGTARRAARGGL